MGFFDGLKNLVSPVLTGVGTLFGGPIGGAIGGALGGLVSGGGQAAIDAGGAYLDAENQRKVASDLDAARVQSQGYVQDSLDFAKNSPLNTVYTPAGADATSAQLALLGLGGDTAASDAAFQRYLDSSGYQFLLNAGNDAITANQAAAGLLNSGSTLKGITDYAQGLASTKFDNYLSHLTGLSNRGLQAGSTVMSSVNNSNNALADIMGQYATGVANLRGGARHSLVEGGGNVLESIIGGLFGNTDKITDRVIGPGAGIGAGIGSTGKTDFGGYS